LTPAFLLGGGQAGELMRGLDWSATPLGRPESWPQALQTLVAVMLGSAQPMFVAWGPSRTMLYNDAYALICGRRHPAAMGAPFPTVWFDIMDEVGPILERAFAGEATHMGDIAFTLHRNDYPEEAHFAFSYTPVRGEYGHVHGVFCACMETTAQVLSERARRVAEARTVGLLESIRDGFLALDRDWRFTHVNGEAERLLGFKAADLIGGVFWDIYPAVRGTEFEAIYLRAAATGEPGSATVFYPDHGRWYEVRAYPWADGISVFFRDVTTERQVEQELREREERLRLIIESVRDYAIFATDPEDRIDTWLPGAEKVFGWSAAEAVGQSAAMIFTPEDRLAGAPEEEVEIARREGVAPDVRWHLRKNGSQVFIEGSVTALRDAGGDIRGFLKIGQDVTARRRSEEANARLAAIVTSTTDAIISFSAEEGRILSWNRGAEELFGYTEAEAVGAPTGLLVPPDLPEGDPTGVFRRTMDGERVHEHATVRVTKAGERVAVSITASRMLAPDGRILGVAAIFRDMRQRKAAEERQTLLAREVDHRAKNVMAVVQSIVQLTRERDPETFKRAIAGRIAALARAQTLLAEDRWSGADLHTLLTGELDPFLGEHRAGLDGPSIALPPGAAQPVAMAVHELATNAVKYGALSTAAGHLDVSWRITQGLDSVPVLRLCWTERGGPLIAGVPTRRGFGSRVLEGTVRGQLGGHVRLEWERSGLVCEIEVPLRAGMDLADAAAPS
jgi:PAS domain S-box-containing protein